MAVAYPPPPSDRPFAKQAKVSKNKVLAICRKVENFTPIGDAMRSEGIHETFQDWEQMAAEGDDPFWAWAVSCLTMAEGHAIVEANRALKDRIDEGDTKAITFFLSKRSNAYRDKKEIDVKHSGTVAHEVVVQKANQMLLDGSVSIADLAARKRKYLEETRGPVLEEREEKQEAHPMFKVVKRPAHVED